MKWDEPTKGESCGDTELHQDMETDVAGCSKGNWQRLGLEPYFHHFPFFSFRALSTNTWNHLEICRTAATQKFL
jgi:hypothetical protein